MYRNRECECPEGIPQEHPDCGCGELQECKSCYGECPEPGFLITTFFPKFYDNEFQVHGLSGLTVTVILSRLAAPVSVSVLRKLAVRIAPYLSKKSARNPSALYHLPKHV